MFNYSLTTFDNNNNNNSKYNIIIFNNMNTENLEFKRKACVIRL